MKNKTLITWVGGKFHMLKHIIPLIPQHITYVEVFGGGASLLLNKRKSKIEVYNDLNSGLVNLFRVVRDKDKYLELQKLLLLTPYSREEFYRYRDTTDEMDTDIIKAYKFFIVCRMAFGGMYGGSWGYSVNAHRKSNSMIVNNYLSAVKNLPEIHERFSGVQVENNDWRTILNTYDTENTFFYLDPPYVISTRKNENYKHEMTDDDHIELIDSMLLSKSKILISGYNNEIYDKLTKNKWKKIDIETSCWSAPKTKNSKLKGNGGLKDQKRQECLWFNYSDKIACKSSEIKKYFKV